MYLLKVIWRDGDSYEVIEMQWRKEDVLLLHLDGN